MTIEEPAQGKVILIVEDDESIGDLMSEIMAEVQEYSPVVAHDEPTAVEILRSKPTSLILLDIHLTGPANEGLELYDKLQEDETTRNIPVLFVTAESAPAGLEERGIADFIAKPFNVDYLLERVAEALGRS